MKKILIIACLTFLSSTAFAKLKIVASSSDLKAIAEEIGGELVEVDAIATGKNNLHYVELLPSYMLKVSKADIYLKVGLNLDFWAEKIIDGSRNGKLLIVDCSKHIVPLEKPVGEVDASMGDVHPEGNPHYWLDPYNGLLIAETIAAEFSKTDPDNKTVYEQKLKSFKQKLQSKMTEWLHATAEWDTLHVIAYHNSWPYLKRAFSFHIDGFIEPKPGIEPTASHTAEIIDLMKSNKIHLIIKEPYFSKRTPKAIAEEVNGVVLTLPSSVGGVKNCRTYFELFDNIVSIINKTQGES